MTPHTLQHSLAYRMLNREEGNTLYDVIKRLRHATIQRLNGCTHISTEFDILPALLAPKALAEDGDSRPQLGYYGSRFV